MNKVIKKISMLEILNQVIWYNGQKENLNFLSIQSRWNLKKNIIEFKKFSDAFYDFKDNLQDTLKTEYITDEKSIETEINQNGQINTVRKIKEEYMDQYQSKVAQINMKINQLLKEEEQISIYLIDVDSEIQNADRNTKISDQTMERLMLYMQENDNIE